jgi:HEAT repeat protein/outer membrane protein assembly factor BamD (BamD/ComL family)
MLHTQTMKNDVTYRSASVRRILSLAIAAVLIVAGGFVNQAAAQKLKSDKMNKFAPQGSKNDAANAKFQGGRDLISDQQYAQAIEKLSEYISAYSKDPNIDAAMYWVAYSQVQLKEFDQAKDTIDRLLKAYEKTKWKGDAQMLLAQLPNGMKIKIDPVTVTVDPVEVEVRTQELQERMKEVQEREQDRAQAAQERALERAEAVREREQERVEAALERMKDFNGVGVGLGVGIGVGVGGPDGSQSDDDPCEFKIVVLQALIQSDPQRGIAAATDWLKPGSTQTQRCKSAALTLLARHGGKEATPTILNVARTESDPKLRAKAISVLGATNDDSVVDALRDFAISSQDNDIAEAALYALSQHQSPRAVTALSEIAMSSKPVALRKVAISAIANRPGEPALDALFKIYDADQNLEIRKSVISSFSHRRSDRAGTKLLEIARGSDNIELRKTAISSIARRGGAQAIDTLLNLYDTEKSEELKDQIINSLGYGALAVGPNGMSYPSDQRVARKLIEIAKNPQTPIERRKRAIGMLSRSKDPEVLKFLEDLLKQ